MNTTNERDAILAALSTWIRQRPSLEYGNYASYGDNGDGRRAYFSEMRRITRQLHDAQALLAAVGWRSSITATALREGFRAYSGRLTWRWDAEKGAGVLDYCPGQYWPTEYRAAACAVLAAVLWEYWRVAYATTGKSTDPENPYSGARDEIVRRARSELGRGIATRWFN